MNLEDKKNIMINGKEYIVTTIYNDAKYGKIIKVVSSKLENFERLYFGEKDGTYKKIDDVEVLEYIGDKYEIADNSIIIM